ncbi:MAG TPA: cytochrome c [Steroidobacteraceae bacterium]|nr:cytochrome c [Steroidobacteraceae bacterium]
MATSWFRKLAPPIALSTLLPVISGCSRGAPTALDGILDSAEARGAGAELFAANCAICHGASGNGHGRRQAAITPPPANLTVPPWSERAGAGRTFLAIREGVPGTPMAPWPMLSDREIWELVAYIETLQEGR